MSDSSCASLVIGRVSWNSVNKAPCTAPNIDLTKEGPRAATGPMMPHFPPLSQNYYVLWQPQARVLCPHFFPTPSNACVRPEDTQHANHQTHSDSPPESNPQEGANVQRTSPRLSCSCGEVDFATQNMSLWHEEYFRLIIFKKQKTLGGLSFLTSPLTV